MLTNNVVNFEQPAPVDHDKWAFNKRYNVECFLFFALLFFALLLLYIFDLVHDVEAIHGHVIC